MDIVTNAMMLARQHHAGQWRKYPPRDASGEPLPPVPYFTHVYGVAEHISRLPGMTEEDIAAGYCHDLLEDTSCDPDTIARRCGGVVLGLTHELTNPSKTDPELAEKPRAERHAADIAHQAAMSRRAKRIKMVDRIYNLNDMEGAPAGFKRLYADESEDLVAAVGDADPMLAEELREAIRRLREAI